MSAPDGKRAPLATTPGEIQQQTKPRSYQTQVEAQAQLPAHRYVVLVMTKRGHGIVWTKLTSLKAAHAEVAKLTALGWTATFGDEGADVDRGRQVAR